MKNTNARRMIDRKRDLERKNARSLKSAQNEICFALLPRHRQIDREELDAITRDLIPWELRHEYQ